MMTKENLMQSPEKRYATVLKDKLHTALLSLPALLLLLTASIASEQEAIGAEAPQGPPPAPVRVATAVSTDLAPTASASGTVYSRNDAQLAAEATGRLTWVADVGARLASGEPVARIDDTQLRLQRDAARAQVQRAEAQLKFLERELKRLTSLADQNNAAISAKEQTESQRDVARADLAAARANLAELEDRLSKTRLTAPFDGIVTAREKNIGERVQLGEIIVRLVDPNDLEVIARAPLSSGRHVNEGDTIALTTGEERRTGTVRSIVPFGDARNHLIELRIDVPANEWTVGEALRVAVPMASPERVIAVPRDALVLRREGAHVYRVDENGSAEQVSVLTGAGAGDLVAVEGGIEAGDRVVIRGGERLRPGQPVRILDDDSNAANANANAN
ncbi:MAG: efflux RND transporter periplasmic adaptor subunit [Gammaproteobacteria bacterium]|nr:efflux RND transporter periplasmic adaptor subunit [Gammaproteobacteria bacterium]